MSDSEEENKMMTKEKKTEMAKLIGEKILEYINPVMISIDGHIPQGKTKGQLLVGYVGTLTDFAKERIKEKEK